MKNIGEVQTPKEDTYDMDAAAISQSDTIMGTSDAWVGFQIGGEEHQSLVDLEAIGKLRVRIGPEGVDELLEIFFEDAPQYLAGLNEAARKSDRKALHYISHIMKSSSGILGMTALSDQCKALSDVSCQMPLVEARYRIDAIEDIYGRTAAFLLRNCFGQKEEE